MTVASDNIDFVIIAQSRLRDLKLYGGAVDGRADPATQAALQRALAPILGNGIGTGAGAATRDLDNTDFVTLAQGYLQALGLYGGPINGHGDTALQAILQTALGRAPRAAGVTSAPLAAPVNTVLPTITGTATEGQSLFAGNGTWTNSPSSFAYQWRRGGVAISGATAVTYTLVTADVGSTITVQVTATNAGGSTTATSAATATVAAASDLIVAGLMGQSNIAYALQNGGPYTDPTILANIPITTPNAFYVGRDESSGGGSVIRSIPITQANVTARKVNIALAQASQWLNFVHPGKTFVFVNLAEAGTSRAQLGDDADPARDWVDFEAIVTEAETTHGPVTGVIEWWYTNDDAANRISDFKNVFSPLYLGQFANNTTFDLSVDLGPQGLPWDHCLWDAEAPTLADKGRGIFARTTKWTYIENHNKNSSRANTDGIAAFYDDPRVQTFAAPKGTWGGLYANDVSHALETDPDGIVYLNWPMVTSIARLAGSTINEPTFVSVEAASDGSYADVLVDLPNGGTLTTIRIKEARGAVPALQLPYQQPVTGLEIERVGAGLGRKPIYKPAETLDENGAAIDNRTKGTVVIQDTGSGSPRRGRIRITPTVPFNNNDVIYPLWLDPNEPQPQVFLPAYTDPDPVVQAKFRAAATKSWLDFPVERITALEDPAATYKFPGVPVRPWANSLTVTGIAAPPFVFSARSAVFGSGFNLVNGALPSTIFAGDEGMVSVWFKCTRATWPTGIEMLMQMRDNGGGTNFQISTSSSGRFTFASAVGTGLGATPSGSFAVGVWQHLLLSWKVGAGGWAQTCINGAAPAAVGTPNTGGTGLNIRDNGVSRIGVSASTSGGNQFGVDIGHFYINLNTALDMNSPTNRQLFINGNNPVSLGQFGEIPTGSAPDFYLDGIAPSWNNLGTGGGLTASAPLAAGTAPLLGSA